MYKLTKEEQETTINWCAADSMATIDSADPAIIRKLDRLAEEYPDVYMCTRVDQACLAKMYTVPARFLRFGKPASAAQREAARLNGQVTRFDTANPPLKKASGTLDVQTKGRKRGSL